MAENPPQQYGLICRYVAHAERQKTHRVQFTPDGLFLAMAFDNTVQAHRFTPYAPSPPRDFIGHQDQVSELSFSSDTRLLATSSEDSTICLWDVDGFLVRIFTTKNNVRELCVRFHPRSNMIASGSTEDSVRIWDVDSGACLRVLPAQPGHIGTLDFSPDGSMIVAGSFGGLCRIWDTATGNVIATVKETGPPPVGSVKFSSDGRFVLVGLMDSTLRIWSMSQGCMSPTIYVGHENRNIQILSMFIRADERYIVSGSEDNSLCIWEVMSGRMVQRIDQAHAGPVQCVSCHPTRNMIASASEEDIHTVKVWTPNPHLATIFF